MENTTLNEKSRPELMQALLLLQALIEYQDIVTISGFMGDDELRRHIARYEIIVSERKL